MKTIKLTKGFVAKVDDEDYEYINSFKWHVTSNKPYAKRALPRENGKQKKIFMHRQILKLEHSLPFVDHIDGDGLNNQKHNLRFANHKQNSYNFNKVKLVKSSSKYRGVSWNKRAKKWHVALRNDGKSYWLGAFDSEKEAALAYNKKAIELRGEFVRINEVD